MITAQKHPLEKRILLPEDLKPINSLAEYKAQGGLKGLERARLMSPKEIVEEVRRSGLRGRGGAGFPTAVKWETVIQDECPTKYVVCNGAEGEPGTYKDRYLIGKNPYVVFEGMLIAARAVGAKQAIIGTKKKFTLQVNRLLKAVEELEEAGAVEEDFLKIVLGPDDYLFGEEKALLEVVDGRGAMPRIFPPFMLGIKTTPLENNPTVVNNVESMSHLALIFRHDAAWYRAMGTDDTPGTMILTLSGDVKRPGMYEVELGLTLRQLIYDIGGGPKDKPIKAVFSGVSNAVITPDMFDAKLDFGSMRKIGAGLGSGGYMVYDETCGAVELTHMISSFLARASCGQCIPCNSGTRYITQELEKLRSGQGTKENLDNILKETTQCTNQTRCFLPHQEVKICSSMVKKFRGEFDGYAQGKVAYKRSLLIPKIESFNEETGEFIFEKMKPEI